MIKRNHVTRDVFKQLWGAQLRIFKIERFYIFIFHCVTCLQLLLLRFPGVVRMNTFLNDAINIFCFKQLKFNFYAYIIFTFYLEIVECVRKYMDGSSQNQQSSSSYNQILSRCFCCYGLWLNKSNRRVKQAGFSEPTDINQSISMNRFYPTEALNFIQYFFVFP